MVLRRAPKWIIAYPPSLPLDVEISFSNVFSNPVSSLNTPLSLSSNTPTTTPCPIGVKKAKRKKITLDKEESGDDHQKELCMLLPNLELCSVETIEEGKRLKREMTSLDSEAKASLVQINEPKVLWTPGASFENYLAKEVLILIQKKFKEKFITGIDAESSCK